MKRLTKINIFILSLLSSQFLFALPDDTSKPIEIQADEASFNQSTGEAIYQGNVFIKQGSIEIQADFLKISTDVNTRQFSQLEATGTPAQFSQQLDDEGNLVISKGNSILYSSDSTKLEIKGEGYLSQLENSITADHITYQLNNGTFSAEKTDSGRVSMTLKPQATEAKK
ncbi:lipopolysaccharide transport periplasmic protein LptA [Marinomonas sp. C2222]|uniref:Lipopolysaccharide export system protein LptA n=1 Tax=Marinomonas sargassi TaxID=2984494 RepID=A0ABT2YT68_9GAMM|nr:lipopolysaccharide transport periplasmic protein LptA [Marinomonas sargassi]MCV2403060.1 lipopolysaccharide transport periplasmic protein LptA [Marinomonas sargassi]